MVASKLRQASRRIAREIDKLEFGPPISHTYNPLVYARAAHEEYLTRYGKRCQALLLGMNPGPWGMAQTGVPFGAVNMVRDWLGIETKVKRPAVEHPKRPVTGFACTREEVSGKRLWGWASERFAHPDAFFDVFFIWNYCPLAFFDEAGRNVTPDKLRAAERGPLFDVCDDALRRIVAALSPKLVIGVGKFAEDRARAALPDFDGDMGRVLHPSPASPAANRGWAAQAESQLEALGVRW